MKLVKPEKIRYSIIFILILSFSLLLQQSPGKEVIFLNNDVLDQEQTVGTSSGSVVCHPYQIAQSFRPTLPILTRVEIRLIKFNDISSDVDLVIRDNLTGNDLAYASVSASSISHAFSWIEFDFPDIEVVVEKTYYIVCKTDGGDWSLSHLYKWSCSNSNPYPRGQAHCSVDGGQSWQPDTIYVEKDHCFRTYGIAKEENHPPDKPEKPVGPSAVETGSAYSYSTVTSDLNGDNIYYLFEWGDESDNEWIGPYASGEIATQFHTWNEQGNYTIKVKARDSHGFESAWSDPLVVAVPLFQHILTMDIQEIFKDWSLGLLKWLNILLVLIGNNFL